MILVVDDRLRLTQSLGGTSGIFLRKLNLDQARQDRLQRILPTSELVTLHGWVGVNSFRKAAVAGGRFLLLTTLLAQCVGCC